MNKDTVIVKITVPREAYERMKIAAAGTPVAPIIAELALKWVDKTGATVSNEPESITAEEWTAVVRWQAASGLTFPQDRPKRKTAVLQWARENGFNQ